MLKQSNISSIDPNIIDPNIPDTTYRINHETNAVTATIITEAYRRNLTEQTEKATRNKLKQAEDKRHQAIINILSNYKDAGISIDHLLDAEHAEQKRFIAAESVRRANTRSHELKTQKFMYEVQKNDKIQKRNDPLYIDQVDDPIPADQIVYRNIVIGSYETKVIDQENTWYNQVKSYQASLYQSILNQSSPDHVTTDPPISIWDTIDNFD